MYINAHSHIYKTTGVTDFSKKEKPRQEFEGRREISLLHGREELFFDPYEKRRRITVSIIFVTLLVCVVIAAIVGAFFIQHAAEDAGGMWEENAALISGLVLAGQIQIFNVICRKVAIKLNDYENHRTNTEYESALVFKIFVFQVINSYASLTYIAFFKNEEDCIGSCMRELQSSLMSIFLVGLFVSNVLETGLPWCVSLLMLERVCCGARSARTSPSLPHTYASDSLGTHAHKHTHTHTTQACEQNSILLWPKRLLWFKRKSKDFHKSRDSTSCS